MKNNLLKDIKPYKSNLSKKKQVEEMFNNVASTYDLINRILSFYIDVYWRKVLINNLKKQKPSKILDVATGTGDLAIALAKEKKYNVIGYDLSQNMLAIAKEKSLKKKLNIEYIQGDAEKMPFPDNEFDAITVAFGVRNFENLELGLKEMNRAIKPDGILYILEFSIPSNLLFRKIYFFYFSKLLPFIGGIISKDKSAYSYLPSSVYNFPYGNQMLSLLTKNGYKNVEYKKLTFGIVSLYKAIK